MTWHDKPDFSSVEVDDETLQMYIQIRELSGIGQRHLNEVVRIVNEYLDFCDFSLTKKNTLDYLQHIKEECSISRYRKKFYQIRKFLNYIDVGWLDAMDVPDEPERKAKRVTSNDFKNALHHFSEHEYYSQIKSILLLGASSGLRAEELYQLNPEDIDLEKRLVYVNHNPENGQTTKTKKSRIAFFNEEAQEALQEYVSCYTDYGFQYLFGQEHIQHIFHDYSLKVKHLRKFFSQEWDRCGGPTGIKKIIMGHSLKGDVDLNHYNAQSEEDLKRIYDNVNITVLP